jgi:hypothetical protein
MRTLRSDVELSWFRFKEELHIPIFSRQRQPLERTLTITYGADNSAGLVVRIFDISAIREAPSQIAVVFHSAAFAAATRKCIPNPRDGAIIQHHCNMPL